MTNKRNAIRRWIHSEWNRWTIRQRMAVILSSGLVTIAIVCLLLACILADWQDDALSFSLFLTVSASMIAGVVVVPLLFFIPWVRQCKMRGVSGPVRAAYSGLLAGGQFVALVPGLAFGSLGLAVANLGYLPAWTTAVLATCLIVGSFLAFSSLGLLMMRTTSRSWHVAALAILIASVILFFGVAYYGEGALCIRSPAGDCIDNYGLGTTLYFSVVTFTTLGLGDIAPEPGFRGMVAAEAVLGYLSMGLFFVFASRWMKGGEYSNPSSELLANAQVVSDLEGSERTHSDSSGANPDE